MLAAVLDGERPDGGVVGQPVPKKFRCIVQPRVALLLNHSRSVRDGLLFAGLCGYIVDYDVPDQRKAYPCDQQS